jgi:hypothetical protein
MLSSIAARAGELLAVAVIAGTLLLAGTAAGMWLLYRRVRRRAAAARLAMAGQARRVAAKGTSAGSRWLWSRPLPDRRGIAAARTRWELRRAVSGAEHAVAVARRAGAPVGDLDGLCVRLREAAADAGRLLAIQSRATAAGGGLGSAMSQVSGLVATAAQIQGAAAASVASMSQPAAAGLADDVRQEVVALSAGLAAAAPRRGGAPGEAV